SFKGDGTPQWSMGFPGSFSATTLNVAVTPGGSAILAISGTGSIDFGLGPTAPTSSEVTYLTKYDQAGKIVWTKRFGDLANNMITRVYSVAVSADGGAIVLGGQFQGTCSFGLVPLVANDLNAFVVELESFAGGPLWNRQYGDAATQEIPSVTTD